MCGVFRTFRALLLNVKRVMLNQVPALLGSGSECSFSKEKSKFSLACTKTDEVLALEELLCGVCSLRTVLSLLRTCGNPT